MVNITTSRHLETGSTDTILGSIQGSTWPGRRVRDVSNEIALLDANNSALITLLMKLRKAPASDPKIEWFEDAFPQQYITVAEGVSSTEGAVTVTTGHGALVRKGDVWWYPEWDEVLYADNVSSNTVTFLRAVGSTDAAGWDNLDELFYIGNAMEMGSQARSKLTTQVTAVYNYCQLFKESLEIDNTAAKTRLYGGPDMQYQLRKHGELHKRDIEKAFWWGERAIIDAATAGTYPAESAAHLTRGVLRWLDSSYMLSNSASTSLTEDEFNTFLETVGRYGNNVKFMFCSPRALTTISSWGRDVLRAVPRDTTWGINITRYISAHLELNLINCKTFAEISDSDSSYNPATSSIILDLEQLRYRAFRDTTLDMNIQENDRDGVEHQYMTECGLELKLPEHHGAVWGWAL